MDEPARQQAFVTALVTEHFVQGSARAATITESNGRAAIYLSAVSSGLVAFGFLAQGSARLDPFVAAVLPALFILGIFTFIRLVQTSIEAAVLSLQIQRIRGYYRTLVPEAQQFFDPPGTNDALAVAMATSGNRASPVEMLFTAAAMIAAVNSILGGAGLALLAGTLTLGSATALTIGVVGAVILFGLHLLYGYRRAAPTAGWSPLMARRRLPPPPQAPGSGQDSPAASPLQPAARTEQPPEMALVEQRPGTDPTRERPQEVRT
jgi:hypothetical protein